MSKVIEEEKPSEVSSKVFSTVTDNQYYSEEEDIDALSKIVDNAIDSGGKATLFVGDASK